MKLFFFTCCAVLTAFASQVRANEQECAGGEWVLVEETRDEWEGEPEAHYTTNGRSMGYWEQPTSCSSVIYTDNFKYVYTKSLVCVPATFIKIHEAEGVGSCDITGKATVQTGLFAWPTDDPCTNGVYMGGGGYASDYGEVTTANWSKKYECDQCPNDPNKTESGQCGCRKPDTDSDRDGVPDCVDGNNNGPPEDCPTK